MCNAAKEDLQGLQLQWLGQESTEAAKASAEKPGSPLNRLVASDLSIKLLITVCTLYSVMFH